MNAVFETAVPGYAVRRGKVRDVYDFGDDLVIVATDRLSAFDWVLPTPIPGKGVVLTALTAFWLDFLDVSDHRLPTPLPPEFAEYADRAVRVRKAEVVSFECVVRGYLAGSAWKEYRQTGRVCGVELPAGLVEAARLPEPIFTPATKAVSGHDENVTFERMADNVGVETAAELRDRSLAIYHRAAAYAESRGILLADTKFEFGRLPSGELVVIDEVLTPDSSRFWPADEYRPGLSPPSFDKQFVRDWLEASGWDKNSPPPELPAVIVAATAGNYAEALRRLRP